MTFRQAIINSLGNHCNECGSVEGLQIDHIIAREDGGEDLLDNFQLLCRVCHAKKTGFERRVRRGTEENQDENKKVLKLYSNEQITVASMQTLQPKLCKACNVVHLLPDRYYVKKSIEVIPEINRIHEILERNGRLTP